MIGVPDSVRTLVENFKRNYSAYKSGDYKEEQLKQEFLNPLFEGLGWDVTNKEGNAPQYRDVIFEDSIKVASGTQAPDYCFTLSGVRKFFVEAKKPSVDVQNDQDAVYQLRRYAWTAKLPLSILTNFESFAIYESRRRPHPDDKASTERIKLLRYEEFADKWNEIADIFSKKAVRQGSFDKFAEATEKKRGTQPVGDEFLNEIERWRDDIARNVALRNPALSIHDLNYSVQRTVDRIVFLRMCEDRGIEPYGQLQSLLKTDHAYEGLCKLYRRSDEKYNSGLFHFDKEKGRNTPPDGVTLGLEIDDSVLKGIIKDLYYPESPYEFSVLPTEILGNIYERFLGKVIRLTEGHHAKVEEKPEVKKAGGVYYTPEYIVDYIVQNTVGRLCEGKSPKTVSELRILDPACGSGSFLLGAYAYLLNYHLDYYTKQGKPERFKDQVYQGKGGAWYLTIKEKKRILLNNIYGVDIDPQAVEVTKLSLLLKVLEGESKDVFERQQKLFRERVLPDLDNNIKCGNSLVGHDIYSGGAQTTLTAEEKYRINAFDWEREFEGVIKGGGFDAVVGNPPYAKIQAMKEWAPVEVEVYKRLFTSASEGNYDIYVVFVEKALRLLNDRGVLGFILPHKFFQAQFGRPLREIISSQNAITEIVHFGSEQVFPSATTYTCLLFLSKSKHSGFRLVSVKSLENPSSLFKAIQRSAPDANYEATHCPQPSPNEDWNFVTGHVGGVLKKLRQQPRKLSDITRKIFVGLQTSADKIYVLRVINWRKETVVCYSRSLGREVELERGLVRPFLMGKDVHRYEAPHPENVVIFPYLVSNGKAVLISPTEVQTQFPNGWQYLLENKVQLAGREKGKMQGAEFYAYIYPKNLAEFDATKIMTPDICKGPQLTIDDGAHLYHTTTIYSFVFKDDIREDAHYFLGVLNSKLLWYFLEATGTVLRGGYVRFKTEYLGPFPIRLIDFANSSDVLAHDRIVSLVDQMLSLHRQLNTSKSDHERTVIQRQVDSTDGEIDKLVYELYGLTPEEIKIVEERDR